MSDKHAEALVELALRRQAEDDFYTFVKLAWPIVEGGKKLVDSWMLKAMAEHLEEVYYGRILRLLINLPPRMTKSTMVSVLFPVWCWIKQPSLQLFSLSYAERLAIRDNVKSRRLIKSSWFQKRWGDRFSLALDQDAKERVDNLEGGYRVVAGMDGSITGDGGDCLVSGTLVSTTEGNIPIEIIAKNPTKYKAISFDFLLDKEVESNIMSSLTRRRIANYEIFTAKGRSIRCTGNHKIYVEGAGFIPASELCVGQRVYCEKIKKGIDWAALRLLREGERKAFIRSKKISVNRFSGFLLLKFLQVFSSRNKEFQALRSMWREETSQRNSVLLGNLQNLLERKEEKKTHLIKMLRVWNRVQKVILCPFILFQKLRGFSSWEKNDWCWKFQLQSGYGMVQRAFCQDKAPDYRKGWRCLSGLQNYAKNYGDKKRIRWVSSRSSYGWRKNQSRPIESSNSMFALPYKTPCGKLDRITAITVHGRGEQPVYDIQVKGTHNFFANGILVHNCIILDDPNNVRDQSETTLETSLGIFTDVLPTRFNDFKTGRMIVVQQRANEKDISGWILSNEKKEWVHLMLPMEFEESRRCVTVPLKSTNGVPWQDPRTEEGELLNPKRIGHRELKRLKSALGSEYSVAGQLQQKPAPTEGGMIKRAWWQPWKHESTPNIRFVIQAWDTATSEKAKSSYSACTTWGIFKDEHEHDSLILLSVWRKKVEFPDLYKAVQRMARDYRATTEDRPINERYAPDLILVEEKSSGIQLIQTLNKTGIVLVGWRPDKYGDKIERVRRVTHLMEAGRVYVPYQAPDFSKPRRYADVLITQAALWPKGESRDLVDTCSMVLQRVINSGWVLHPLEQEASQQGEWRREYLGQEERGLY